MSVLDSFHWILIGELYTSESSVHRFANFSVHPKWTTLLVSILEDHTNDTPQTVETTLCVINTITKNVSRLQGIPQADFFASPIFSPDGKRLAWQQWYHPDMPWEGAELYVADVDIDVVDGQATKFCVNNMKHIAGRKNEISVAYPSWANSANLIFTSDESGYQNPWIYSTATDKARPVFSSPVSEDFSEPAWTLGGSPYALIDASGHTGLFTAFRGGRSILYLVDLRGGTQPHEVTPCPFTVINHLRQISPGKPDVVFFASKSDGPSGVIQCTMSSSVIPATPVYTILKSTESSDSGLAKFPIDIISVPRPITFHISPDGIPLHVVLYAPTNPIYAGSSIPGEKPPCVLSAHGGTLATILG